MTLKLGVVGASGKTGSEVVRAVSDFSDFALHVVIVSPASKFIGVACGTTVYESDPDRLLTCDVVVEFASPAVTLKVLGALLQSAKPIPLLIATTGHSSQQMEEIALAAKKIPILLAPNTSLGVYALRAASRLVQSILGSNFDARVLDLHHHRKRDAPSGTARHIASDLELDLEELVEGAPKVVSLRGGDEPGHHSVYFLGNGERLELSHVVHNRATFGVGALHLSLLLSSKPAGLYSVDDLLSRK